VIALTEFIRTDRVFERRSVLFPMVFTFGLTWVNTGRPSAADCKAHPPQGDRFLALQTAQASGIRDYVGWRAEQENWIVGRLDPIRHDKGIVVDLITAGLHLGRGRVMVSVPAFSSRRFLGHNTVEWVSESPGSPIVRIMSQRAGPFARRSINSCSRKLRGFDFSSASDSCFSPACGTKRNLTFVILPPLLTNLNV
jgi:hypothetical protein